MSKGIKVNNGHVNEVATQIETAKSYFRHVPLVPQDSKTTISANSKSKECRFCLFRFCLCICPQVCQVVLLSCPVTVISGNR